ncbi:MAG: hypothetical protein ACYC5V_13845 [Gemmatimonadaceae bacterium]
MPHPPPVRLKSPEARVRAAAGDESPLKRSSAWRAISRGARGVVVLLAGGATSIAAATVNSERFIARLSSE